MNLFSMILDERGYGEIFQALVHLNSEAAYSFVWVFQGATEDADANGDVLKGEVGLYGSEPPRVSRRQFSLSQAAAADSSSWR
jgi:hypothetical protein